MRDNCPTTVTSDGERISVTRSAVLEPSLSNAVSKLENKLKLEGSSHIRAHYTGLIATGKYILTSGPIVKTQSAGEVFSNAKKHYLGSTLKIKTKKSIQLLETLSKHLPVMQIYIHGTGFLMERKGSDVQNMVNSLSDCVNYEEIRNKFLREGVRDDLSGFLNLMDTELDKQVLKAIFVKIFSVNSVNKLEGTKCKSALINARDIVPMKVNKMKEICTTSQIVRNDMSVEAQHRFTKRKIGLTKTELIRSRVRGAGRNLKISEFQELSSLIEGAFSTEAQMHPRLTDNVLYRSAKCVLTMAQARDILLLAAPDNFKISLSSCYNYTQNYKENTHQAKQHHHGRGINANISFHVLPRTGLHEEPLNAHFAAANVNVLLDEAAGCPNKFFVDSKDAKGIVCTDSDPVQNVGKSWKKTNRAEHQFEQSRVHACTPMTHLLLNTVKTRSIATTDSTLLFQTRTGQAVTLMNLSYYEPETVFRCFNELFHLVINPSFDEHFRSPTTGKLKANLVFLVDNGASECPSNPCIQMLLARLLKILQPYVHRVVQVSFAEYMSKQNPVERTHAEENRALSTHGPFKKVELWPHADAKPGSSEHMENMEAVAEEIISAIGGASYGGKPIITMRGVKENFLFSDEQNLRVFLKMSEQKKDECLLTYEVDNQELMQKMIDIWQLETDFSGSYIEDYKLLRNQLGERTSWLTKYQTALYTPSPVISVRRHETEPLPDYIRWIRTNELHYMTVEHRQALPSGPWNGVEGMYLPTRIMDLLRTVLPQPPTSLVPLMALLCWVPEKEFQSHFTHAKTKCDDQLQDDIQRDMWKHHPLFKIKKEELVSMCQRKGLPYLKLNKVDLVKALAGGDSKGEGTSTEADHSSAMYNGDLSKIPMTMSALTTMTVGQLKEILKFHNISHSGVKDDLVLKVFLLRNKRSSLTIQRELKALRNLIQMCHTLVIEQRKLYLDSSLPVIYRFRTYSQKNIEVHQGPRKVAGEVKESLRPSEAKFQVPEGTTEKTVHKVFEPLLEHLDQVLKCKLELDADLCSQTSTSGNPLSHEPDIIEQCKQIGARVKVLWNRDEIGDSGWQTGYYMADVQGHCAENGTVDIMYLDEPDVIYTVDLTEYVASGKLRLVKPVF